MGADVGALIANLSVGIYVDYVDIVFVYFENNLYLIWFVMY